MRAVREFRLVAYDVKDPDLSGPVLDANLPDAAADAGERPAV
jgi:hypothetical protein